MPLEYRDHNYHRMRQRTIDWAEHQLVSLLEVQGIGGKTLRALHKVGIETASQLMHADADDLANRLAPRNIPPCRPHDRRVAIIRQWQETIARLCREREQTPDTAPCQEQDLSRTDSGAVEP